MVHFTERLSSEDQVVLFSLREYPGHVKKATKRGEQRKTMRMRIEWNGEN
jgi:hypothetical protein